ncbi:hypothetical protein [Mucilaginibacter lappiensis]|nr:hypothetical protein [Mucilaginibacter lappiensis]
MNKTARFHDKKESGLVVDINIRKVIGSFGGEDWHIVRSRRGRLLQ